jgi:tetratricopeptide (TPR) repeat protein
MADHAFLYFRDPAFIADVPDAKRADLQAEDEQSARRLAALKQAIRNAGLRYPPYENYPCRYDGLRIDRRRVNRELLDEAERAALLALAEGGIVAAEKYERLDAEARQLVDRFGIVHLAGLEQFGQRVSKQLWEAIQEEHRLPDTGPAVARAETDALAAEADYHEQSMESRLRVYVGRDGVQQFLTTFAEEDDEVVCVLVGPPGSGKSAALARFVTQYRRDHLETLVIPHFVGASPYSTSLHQMLRRFCLLLADRFGFSSELPEETDKLVTTFRGYLASVPAESRVMLAIDGVNQLDETDQAHELHWLPEQLPRHVKVIASCIAGPDAENPELEAFGRRMYCQWGIGPLEEEERRGIIREVPSLSAKTLDQEQVRLLLSNPATANPLFLLVALEELRGFGSFQQLNARIADFPREGDTLVALFVQVIERLEEDFDTNLVCTVFTLLASARRGLCEEELQALVADIPGREDLFPALRQLRPYLLNRGHLLDFHHQSLANAVRQRHLASEEARQSAHLRLADYFAGRELGERKVEELPWQLAKACAWRRLYGLLADLPFFAAAWQAVRLDLMGYRVQVETNSHLRLLDAYQCVVNQPARHQEVHVWNIATLLYEKGHAKEALALQEHLVATLHKAGDEEEKLQAALGNQALVLDRLGDWERAMRLYKQQEEICRRLGILESLQECLGNQALIHGRSGRWDEAFRLHDEEEETCQRLGDKRGLVASLVNRSRVLLQRRAKGDLQRVMTTSQTAERICRELGDRDGLQRAVGNQALVLKARNDLDAAMRRLIEQERVCCELGLPDSLQRCWANQANILEIRGDLDGAMKLNEQVERICRDMDDRDSLQRCLGNQGNILAQKGLFQEALDKYRQKERICRDLPNLSSLSWVLSNQALLLASKMDRAQTALPLAEEGYRLAIQHGFHELARSAKPILDFTRERAMAEQQQRASKRT